MSAPAPSSSSFDVATRLESAVQRMGAEARSLPTWLRLMLVLPGLVAATYWFVTQSGPWAWGVHLFSNDRGEVLLAGPPGLVIIAALGPSVVLTYVIARIRNRR